MKAFLNAWAVKYEDQKYLKGFYFDSLVKIRQADCPEVLAAGIIGMLHWKDGKVKRGDGIYCLNGMQYILSKTKPNTYFNDKHDKILRSYEFYIWAKNEVVGKDFSIKHLNKLTSGGFRLWDDNSLIIPTFLLHILAPEVYPIYDQHVERAKRVLTGQTNELHSGLTPDDYISYKEFFDSGLKDMFGTHDVVLEQRKLLDDALWAFGKWMKNYMEYDKKAAGDVNTKMNSLDDGNIADYTPDNEFKKRVMLYIKQGFSQLEAMKRGSDEFGVRLKDSYYLYPGSHINRWRKQDL